MTQNANDLIIEISCDYSSQNRSGILFPIGEEISQTETDLIAMIKTTGKDKNYELIEYILDINTQYTQVLMELNGNGAMDAAYTYGVSRLTEDRSMVMSIRSMRRATVRTSTASI